MIGYRIKVGPYSTYEYLFKPSFSLYDADRHDLELIVQEACADFRDNHDGWEAWREGDADVELFDPCDGSPIFKCKASLIYEPSYEIWGIVE